jgi:hypothetical protein
VHRGSPDPPLVPSPAGISQFGAAPVHDLVNDTDAADPAAILPRRYPGAYAALKKVTNGKAVPGPHGSIYLVRPGSPTSVYVAFRSVDFEMEFYDPSPSVAKTITAAGRVAPVR